MRINKFMAECGVGSRRFCETLIIEGRVSVNETIVKNLGFQVDEAKDAVCLDKKKLILVDKKYYILLNKPQGYLCTNTDPYNRLIARSLIEIKDRLYTIGRLDLNTEGLIIFTNDGTLAHRLAHPNYKVEKTYELKINTPIENKDIQEITKGGIVLEEGKTLPAKLKILNKSKKILMLIISEGKKRQIRRVFKILGYNVLHLKRTGIGNITDKKLGIGKYRFLTKTEISYLKKSVNYENF
jgi:23S rRNA pseudouridine2605 synthase